MPQLETLLQDPLARAAFGTALLLLAAWLGALVAARVLARSMAAISRRTPWRWDDALVEHGVFRRLAQVVPPLVVAYGFPLIAGVPPWLQRAVVNASLALVVLFVVLTVNAGLSALEHAFGTSRDVRNRSVKGYVQLLKILVCAVGGIVIVAILIDRSPMTLLAGLGAVSAVLLLIFKDTILSVVASIQLRSNDMLRVGDWIEVPGDHVDGFVVDVALHTIKVQNWDKTVSTVPTWHLISQSYRNWRGMYESGGRRIRRAVNIDLTSVRFLEDAEVARLARFHLLDGYFERKQAELGEWNAALGDAGRIPVNQRRLSNLGTFRAYMQAYIHAHPHLNHAMLCTVRQLDPGPTGIPLQIYAYTSVTDFVPHENVQADLFDHLISILPEFGLRVFQQPSGGDVRAALGQREAVVSGPS
jgi:miniconductance mechanosensitive channel